MLGFKHDGFTGQGKKYWLVSEENYRLAQGIHPDRRALTGLASKKFRYR
jgi:hypothetical protein